MPQTIRLSALVLAAGSVLYGSAVLAQAAPQPNGAAEPIKIGMIEGMSGAFANAGEAVARAMRFAIERVNARGGVTVGGTKRQLELVTFDNKGQAEESLVMLKAATDQRTPFIIQGNSSAVAGALVEGVNKHNAREPNNRALFLNYSAVDPALTNDKCSFWHFRFDAHTDMRMSALVQAIKADPSVKKYFLINQDYAFGQSVAAAATQMLTRERPDVQQVGAELHPIGKVKDFSPYITKIRTSGADTVITGNWGNDLTLLVKAAKEAGLNVNFYTFYGNSLGAVPTIGEAGVGRVRAVAEWHYNLGGAASDKLVQDFRVRYTKPADDYLNARFVTMVDMLAGAIERAGSTEAAAVARALEGARHTLVPGAAGQGVQVQMRADDHQLITPLVVSVMQKAGSPGVKFDIEGSGYGFATQRVVAADQLATAHSCKMARPAQ